MDTGDPSLGEEYSAEGQDGAANDDAVVAVAEEVVEEDWDNTVQGYEEEVAVEEEGDVMEEEGEVVEDQWDDGGGGEGEEEEVKSSLSFDVASSVAGAVDAAIEGEEIAADNQQVWVDNEDTEGDVLSEQLDPTAAAAGTAAGSQSRRGSAVGPPETDVSAEVVLIMTSLGSVRRMYFASKRAQHFLNCKGIVYYVIDINRDVSDGAKLCDQELYEQWKQEGILLKDPSAADENSIQIPQVLVDGVPIGDETMLQDMEEDGDLDWIFARAACAACLNEKGSDQVQCPNCQTIFRTLVPEEKVYSAEIQQLFKGQNFGALGVGGEVFEHPQFRTPFSGNATAPVEHGASVENFSYEDLFGEPPPDDAAVEDL